MKQVQFSFVNYILLTLFGTRNKFFCCCNMAAVASWKSVGQDGITPKNTLVKGELADLEAIRQHDTKMKSFHRRAHLFCHDLQFNVKIVRQNPRILIKSLIIFVILCGCGLGLVFFVAKDQDKEDKNLALDLATESGRWFCKYNDMHLELITLNNLDLISLYFLCS